MQENIRAQRQQAEQRAQQQAVQNKSFVEVYIWLGRSEIGEINTATYGGMRAKKDSLARCGHAALGVFRNLNEELCYISLWPEELVESLKDDEANEGGLPDAIIRLHHLDMGIAIFFVRSLMSSWEKIKERFLKKEIRWTMENSNYADVTDPKNKTANCASFVFTFLKAGGFSDKTSVYYKNSSGRGPKQKEFYNATKCDAGMRAGGMFDGFPWTNSWFTPKRLLLRTVAAAESYDDDRNETMKIMASQRVSKT